jgi:hypothetical protein
MKTYGGVEVNIPGSNRILQRKIGHLVYEYTYRKLRLHQGGTERDEENISNPHLRN